MTTETAGAERIALPGGEMLAWSDLRTDAPAGGGPLAALAARVVPAGARVLLAGPHEPAFLERLAHAEVTCLLRSHLDGVALASLAGDRPVRMVVGGSGGLPAGETFDVVIAGSGLDAVESVEGAQLGWDGVLARLVGALRPEGTLLLRMDNPVGLHRIVDVAPWYADRDDAAWTISGVLHTGHPANLDQLRGRLTDAGLRPDGCFAAYPHPAAAAALLATGPLDDGATSGLFDAVLHGACAGGFADRTVLQDPARLAVDALHAGLGTALAPGWVVLARRGGVPGPDRAGLPVALVQTGPPGIGVVEVVAAATGWRWRVTEPPVRPGATAGPYASRKAAYRDAAALTGPVPAGRLLRTVLLDACLRRDLETLRRLLTGYAGWLGSHAVDGRLSGAAALAGPDNVVVAGDEFAVLDPSWRAAEPLGVDVALARSLWRFAALLLTGGYAHPWSSTLDLAGLTVVLGGLAGRDLDRATVAAAVEAEAAVVAAMRGLDAGGRLDVAGELRAIEPTAPPPDPASYQQLREAWLRQREELGRVRAVLRWTEDLLTSRERALRRSEAMINLLSGSVSFRVGRLLITPARLARRAARAGKRRLRAALRQRRGREEQQ